jgi:hypothetical protein
MTSSSPAPKLPLWIFILTDAVLVAAAGFIAYYAARPWSQATILSIVGCIIVGTIALCVPLIAYYERQKNETLDDRQRALESLARTVASSAEQISIAANGLHEIAELTHRNVKHAEQLPHKLQEKIAEFQAQLTNANDAEKEELEKQLEELRASETERLQSLSDRLTRVVGEFAKLETSTHQHLIAANDAVSKLSFGTASAIGKAQAAAEQALAQARQEAAKALGDATVHALKSIEGAQTKAIAGVAEEFDRQVARINEATQKLAAAVSGAPSTPPPAVAAAPAETPVAEKPAEVPSAPDAEPTDAPPKRTRKPRRHDPSESPAVDGAPATLETAEAPAPAGDTPAAPATEPAHATEIGQEPAPVVSEKIAEVAPVAPATAQPFAEEHAQTNGAQVATADEPANGAAPSGRKRGTRKPAENEPALGLELDEMPTEASRAGETVLSSDGATRLIVTAYIGIGNRLFIRGNGPGLSWDKGVPLQFVSIGKWRWETNDANAPVQFKLLKNDEQETAGLSALTIEPGHQHEVTANFA